MQIKSIQVENYKSFSSSGLIEFDPGFNTIVGANNSGKTALIEAISLRFENRPHRSESTVPSPGDSPPGLSRVEVDFQVSPEELRSFLWPAQAQFNVRKDPAIDLSHQRDQVISGFSQPFLDVRCKLEQGNLVSARLHGIDADYPHKDAFQFQLDSRDAEPTLFNDNVSADDSQLASFSFAQFLIQHVYFFRAERFHVGQHGAGADPKLAADATNLAQVLNVLQTSNPDRFSRLVGLIKLVFPDVRQITVPPISGNKVRISLWSIRSASERQDLAIPLQESGTGVGQVLAILYVALTSDYSQPILIDEPQSFLHPGAIRKLFDILRQDFDRHQYIVTTHSDYLCTQQRSFQ